MRFSKSTTGATKPMSIFMNKYQDARQMYEDISTSYLLIFRNTLKYSNINLPTPKWH